MSKLPTQGPGRPHQWSYEQGGSPRLTIVDVLLIVLTVLAIAAIASGS